MSNATIQRLRQLFFYQSDHHAEMWKSRRGTVGYSPACAHRWNADCKERRGTFAGSGGNPCRDCPYSQPAELTDARIAEHLRGARTLGAYQLREDGTVGWLCLDFDLPPDHDNDVARHSLRELVTLTRREMENMGAPAYAEFSGSKGYHLWVFCPEGAPAAQMRTLGRTALDAVLEFHTPAPGIGDIEVFPKQDAMPSGDFGNLVKVPLGVNLKSGKRCAFVDDAFNVIADQKAFLAQIETITALDVADILADWASDGYTPPPVPSRPATASQSPLPNMGRLAASTVDVLQNGAPEGERNERLFRAACDLLGNGQTPEQVRATLTPIMQQAGLDQSEIDQTLTSAEARPRSPAVPTRDEQNDQTDPHFIVDAAGRMVYRTPRIIRSRSGEVMAIDWSEQIVANFAPRITKEIELRDGETSETTYTIQGFASRPFTTEIDGAAFRDDKQCKALIGSAGGAKAIIYLPRWFGIGVQEISNDYDEEVRYTSIGWQKVDGRWQYITPQGDIGGYDGPDELARYGIRKGNFGAGSDALVNGLLEAFPHRATYFALAHAFLAPMFRYIKVASKRYALHLVGETGSLKTSYACALLCLYGAEFVDEEPTEKWTSTANKIEVLGYHAKDALYLVDDFKPRLTATSAFATVLHNYSDGRGRGRLNRNAQIQRTKFIRGALLSTGEDLPEREASVISRMLILHLPRPEGTNEALRLAQQQAVHLNAVMHEYLAWLSDNELDLEANLGNQILNERDALLLLCPPNATNPGRLCTNIAQNKAAWVSLCRFLQAKGVWDEAEADARVAEYNQYVPALIDDMTAQINKERASETFLIAIRALLNSGRAELIGRDELESQHNKLLLGWYDEEFYYVMPPVAYAEAQRWWRSSGEEIGFSLQAVLEQLVSDGLLVASGDRPTCAIRVGTGRDQFRRVAKLRKEALDVGDDDASVPQSLEADILDAFKGKMGAGPDGMPF